MTVVIKERRFRVVLDEDGNVVVKSFGTRGAVGPAGPEGDQGVQGIPGIEGEQGIQGELGPTGATGPQGETGDTGADGPTGATGPQGVQGVKGDTGNTGATGATGSQGIQGNTGSIGATGPQGSVGPTGSQGIQGIQGEKGDQGDVGPQGIQGVDGPQGPDGLGESGAQGPQGVQGETGSEGPQGIQGEQGVQGPEGETGPQGETGLTGSQGEAGPAGADGEDGADGAAGPAGADGVTGPTGATGPAGATGSAGATGPTGSTGATGATGATGPEGEGFTAKGTYIAGYSYSRYDTVLASNGSAYTSLSNGNVGHEPSANPDYWLKSVDRGASGAAGADGPTGATGATGPTGATGATGPTGATGASGAISNAVDKGTTGGAVTWNCASALWSEFSAVLNADIAITLSNLPASGMATLLITNPSTYTVSVNGTSIPGINSAGTYDLWVKKGPDGDTYFEVVGGVNSLPTQTLATETTTSLANYARVSTVCASLPAPGVRVNRVVADRACRVRLYSTTAQRDADATRPSGVDPTGNHGLLLDVVLTPGVLDLTLSPAADVHAATAIPITVDNLSGATSTVAVNFYYVKTEA